MPFFFILPMWFLCVLIGVVLCLFKRYRFLSLYLVLGSTGGAIASLALSTFLLWGAPKLLSQERAWEGLILIVAYLGSIVIGGVVGMIAGFMGAVKLNQRLRWTRASNSLNHVH
jgi:hypothetical protein